MKVFGKSLFEKATTPLYDFAQFGLIKSGGNSDGLLRLYTESDFFNLDGKKKKKNKKKEEPKIELTPKGVFQCGALNDNNFVINIDQDYLYTQIAIAKKKLSLLPKPPKGKNSVPMSGATMFGYQEIESIITRLENRFSLVRGDVNVKDIVEKYPHTTSDLINDVLKKNTNLSFHLASDFVPDFPVEAIEAMKDYEHLCYLLCKKKPVFYVIAQQKDFEKRSEERRVG